MVDLDELLRIAEAIILVDVSRAQKPPIPHWETSWRGRRPCPMTPLIIHEVAEVFAVMTVLSQVAVLGNPPPHVVVG
jgi:hypothetical protein